MRSPRTRRPSAWWSAWRRRRRFGSLLNRDPPAVSDDQWTLVRDAVLRVLDDEDPMGLEPGRQTPAGEYRPEALDLTRLFLIDGVVTVEHVELCWEHWFSERPDPPQAAAISRRATTAAWRAFYRPDHHASGSRLRESGAAVLTGLGSPRAVIAEASARLAEQPSVDGDLNRALVDLACLYGDASAQDVLDRLALVLAADGEPLLSAGSEDVAVLALRLACRRFLSGDTDLRSLCGWAHSRIGHDGPASAQPLVEADDDLDSIGTVTRESEHGARVARLAFEFLVATG